MPLNVEDADYHTLFPGSVNGTLYTYDEGSYISVSELQPGKGYWLRLYDNEDYSIAGEEINEVTISLSEGWNMISILSISINVSEIQDPNEIIIPDTFYNYFGTYSSISNLEPGEAYWVRASAPGEITIPGSR